MKNWLKLSPFFFLLCLSHLAKAQCPGAGGSLIVNEISNGEAGNKEYFEFIVLGDPANPIAAVNLEGWIIDDSNAGTGTGNAMGHIKLGAAFNAVKPGTIIVIYNETDVNAAINLGLNEATGTDANCDGVIQIPSTSAHLSACSNLPVTSSPNYTPCTAVSATVSKWTYVSLSNSIDMVQVRKPDATFVHGIRYGSASLATNVIAENVIDFTESGLGSVFAFSSCDWLVDANFARVAATSTSQTPGAPNNPANASFIKNARLGLLCSASGVAPVCTEVPATVTNVVCSGNNAVATISFAAVATTGTYEVRNTITNALYGTLSGVTTTSTVTITATIPGPTVAGSVDVTISLVAGTVAICPPSAISTTATINVPVCPVACVNPAAPTASVTMQPTCTTPTGTIVATLPAEAANVAFTLTGTSPAVAAVTQASASFAGRAPGTYSLTTTNTTTGCTSSEIILTVNPVPTAPATGIDPTGIICAGTSALLTGTSPATGTWSAQAGNPNGATLGSTTAGVANVSFITAETGTYNFIYTADGCTATTNVTVVSSDFGNLDPLIWPIASATILAANKAWLGQNTTGSGIAVSDCSSSSTDPADGFSITNAVSGVGTSGSPWSLAAGSSYNAEVTVNGSGAAKPVYWAVWYDANNDGDFTDAADQFFTGNTNHIGGGGAINTSFRLAIPGGCTASSGAIRVAGVAIDPTFTKAMNGQGAFTNGEVEDYFVTVSASAGSDYGDLSTAPQASAAVTTCTFTGNAPAAFDGTTITTTSVYAGSGISTEAATTGIASASIDAFDDGLGIPTVPINPGYTYNYSVTLNANRSGVPVFYRIWFDWNNDGNLANDNDGNGSPATYAGSGTTASPVTVIVPVKPPFGASANYKIRLIVSDAAIADVYRISGAATVISIANGEIEDYNAPATLLPVTLISFDAEKQGNTAHLTWATANEQNTKHFELESSTDGRSFTKIATVNAGGTGNHNYNYNDKTVYSSNVCYRLKMVDTDGKFTYSMVLLINQSTNQPITIYPNPATDKVYIKTTGMVNRPVLLTDAKGALLRTIIITQNQQAIDIQALPTGRYTLTFSDKTSYSFIKN